MLLGVEQHLALRRFLPELSQALNATKDRMRPA
jgi:hypothetical protein